MRRVLCLLVLVAFVACASARFDGTTLPARPAPAFTLTDQAGRPWSLSAQRGSTIALYFGYTHCPDDCPLTLAKLSRAISASGAASRSEIVFVTIDPQRDTPPVLAAFLRHFHGARIVGLTGSPAAVRRVETAYHVWSQRLGGNSAQYEVAHATPVYLIDAGGALRVVHDDSDAASAFAHDLRLLEA